MPKRRNMRKVRSSTVRRPILRNAELKFTDRSISFVPDGNGEVRGFGVPEQGTGQSECLGVRVFVTSLHVRGFVEWRDETSAATAAAVRTCVVLALQNNELPINTEEIFQNINSSATIDYRNQIYLKKYRVLSDSLQAYSPFFINQALGSAPRHLTSVAIDLKCGFVMEKVTSDGGDLSVSTNLPLFYSAKFPDSLGVIALISVNLRMRFYDI